MVYIQRAVQDQIAAGLAPVCAEMARPLTARRVFRRIYHATQPVRSCEELVNKVLCAAGTNAEAARLVAEHASVRQTGRPSGKKRREALRASELEQALAAWELGELLVAQVPEALGEFAVRRRHLYGWGTLQIAASLNVSHGTVTNAVNRAFDWIDRAGILQR